MGVYGIDYLNNDEDILYLVVDAESEDEARTKAGKILNSHNIPKRNIIQVEYLDWLDK